MPKEIKKPGQEPPPQYIPQSLPPATSVDLGVLKTILEELEPDPSLIIPGPPQPQQDKKPPTAE